MRRTIVRRTLKIALFAVWTFLVLFPKVWLLPACAARFLDLNAALDPNAPGLIPLEAQVRAAVPADAPVNIVAQAVEAAVYRRLPYRFDWDNWGVVCYIPSVDEALRRGYEDCDGRAVVAASLLRRLGYRARLACDIQHMWVVAEPATATGPAVGLMGPGAGPATLAATDAGTRVSLAGLLGNLGRGLGFGIAVFPVFRELLIVAGLWLLTLHPRLGRGRAAIGAVCLLAGLFALRWAHSLGIPGPLVGWSGVGVMVGGWVLMLFRGADRRFPPATAGSPATDAPPPD